jgi:hypothetical protein
MNIVSRRTFLGGSGALAFAGQPSLASAALECVSAHVPPLLTVDCASRRNYAEFRSHPGKIALVGVVSMTQVKGKFGTYTAGSLLLFPVVKPGAKASGITAVFPTSAKGSAASSPLSVGHNEESFLAGILVAPMSQFIGFMVDGPFDRGRARTTRFTNGKLPDGTNIGINWTVSNLNRPWFAGSPTIPQTDQCHGKTWRQRIIEGLKQATVARC